VLNFACRDLAGNVNTTLTTFNVATTAPVVTSITPQGGYKNSAVTVTVVTSAAANCSFSTVDGTSYASMTLFTVSTGGTTHTTAVTSSQGLNHIYVLCSANGVSMTSSVLSYYTYDTIAPSVYDWGTLTSYPANTTKAWIFASEELNSSSLRMTFNGSNMDYFYGNGSMYTYIYDFTALADGVYYVNVSVCTDLAGNPCVLEPVYIPMQVTVDRAAPTATIAYDSVHSKLTVNTTEAAYCVYGYSDVAYSSMPYGMPEVNSSRLRHAVTEPSSQVLGTYVYVRCMDVYGNAMGESVNVSIYYDNVAPSIIGSEPSGIHTSSAVTLSINTSEAASCKYSTSAFNYSSGGTAMTGAALTHTSSVLTLADGTYSYYVLCQDTAGNTMASGFPVTFVVDTTGNFNYTYSLNLGWNSVWLPRIILQNLSSFNDSNYSTVNVLNTRGNLTGFYNYVYYRNGTACSSQNGSCWLSYVPGRDTNSLQEFSDWDNLPYWLNMNATGKRLAFQ